MCSAEWEQPTKIQITIKESESGGVKLTWKRNYEIASKERETLPDYLGRLSCVCDLGNPSPAKGVT